MAFPTEFLPSKEVYLLATIGVCFYIGTIAVYRLYLSPLAKFPGPKLAALTFWVEFYHDVVRRGQYTFEIAKLHEKYGTVFYALPA